MPIKKINPPAMGAEPPSYANALLVEGGSRTLYAAGQVGIDASGAASSDFEAQARQAWANVGLVLAEAGMAVSDIVKTTIYLIDPADLVAFASVRTSVLQGHKPASTLVYVKALAKPEWKVEIDVIAAR